MKLVLIFGPHAVGKMTVGQELIKINNSDLSPENVALMIKNKFCLA